MTEAKRPLSIVVVGASGDLARKKVFPALFALYCQGHLPEHFNVFGFARSAYTDEEFRNRIQENLTCRYVPGESCADRMDEFLARCSYVSGQYASSDSFLNLFQAMQTVESTPDTNRCFYLAIPPSIFVDVARAIGNAGLVACGTAEPWSRVVIEKPFGRDRESSDVLTSELAKVFTEEQTYRIDHYLGKEAIQNLMVLRFANLVFDPIWNRDYIDRVCINWKEDIGVEGRGGYFDQYGIIRDVVQNHLLQILALVAMDRPASIAARHVRDEKIKILTSIGPLTTDHILIGQYGPGECEGKAHIGYAEDESVPSDSLTPTYAAAVLRVDNDRWRNVPFIVRAGKALDSRLNEVRVHFKETPDNIFADSPGENLPNEFVVRIQPDEALYLGVTNKEPGLTPTLAHEELNLRYKAAFDTLIPDAYECLLLDVIDGDKSLFIRADELAAAWDIFTPVLHQLESKRIAPEIYAFGSKEPTGVTDFLTKAKRSVS